MSSRTDDPYGTERTKEINQTIELLRQYLLLRPYLRVGQVMTNFKAQPGLYYVEDQGLVCWLKTKLKEETPDG